jgi:hypothetical protein
MSTVAAKLAADKGIPTTSTTSLNSDVPPLGAPLKEKKSFFKRSGIVAQDAIATQVRAGTT